MSVKQKLRDAADTVRYAISTVVENVAAVGIGVAIIGSPIFAVYGLIGIIDAVYDAKVDKANKPYVESFGNLVDSIAQKTNVSEIRFNPEKDAIKMYFKDGKGNIEFTYEARDVDGVKKIITSTFEISKDEYSKIVDNETFKMFVDDEKFLTEDKLEEVERAELATEVLNELNETLEKAEVIKSKARIETAEGVLFEEKEDIILKKAPQTSLSDELGINL